MTADEAAKKGNEFSVCQFFEDGSYEYIKQFVSPEKAIETFNFYIDNVAARIGVTRRVIITGGDDVINMEWQFGKGIVFPTKEDFKP